MRTQVVFRKQLLVRFDDNTQIGRRRSCRRQKCTCFQPTGLDRAPQFAL
jgi:hypothetical protein